MHAQRASEGSTIVLVVGTMLALMNAAPVAFSPLARPTGRLAPVSMSEAVAEAVATEPPPYDPVAFAKDLPGVTYPLGFFDPLGFCAGEAREGRIRFLREAELKHGRVSMLAAVGFAFAEQVHPLWGGNVDVPSYIAFQQTPLQQDAGWKTVLAVIGLVEIASISSFMFPLASGFKDGKEYYNTYPWMIKSKHVPGDFGFDPAGFKPSGAAEFKSMQTKELNNGRCDRHLC